MNLDKASTMKSGQMVFTVWGHVLRNGTLDVYVRGQVLKGKPRAHNFIHKFSKPRHLINGSVCGRYFKSKRKAEKFCSEIKDGLHIDAVTEMRWHDEECDRLDDALNDFSYADDDQY